jgi:UDP-GlcNAc:undecaprenyl-phosphate GlcNAc-1-phosphate transferase
MATVVAAVVTSALVTPAVRLALALQVLDRPDARKDQVQPVPRLGGLAVGLGLGIALLFAGLLLRGQGQLALSRTELLALGLGTFMVFLVGLVDDVVGVSSLNKLLVEIAAAFLIVRVGWSFEVLGVPGGGSIELGVLGQLASILWIVGVTNAINLIDGLDGLAGGVVALISASFLALALIHGNQLTAVAMAAVMGACLGFLRHNWAPARIYLGDSGALTLGFVLATTSVYSSLKAPAAVAILVPILALGVPVMDTLLVMGVRFLARPKDPASDRFLAMFRADRKHLHHLLLRLGPERGRAVVWIYAAVGAFCAFALATALTKSPALGVALVVVEFITLLAMRGMGMRAGARALSEQKRSAVRELYLQPPSERAS